jgi:protein-S-isoprenylcysteine O-methyltransferase Ste14
MSTRVPPAVVLLIHFGLVWLTNRYLNNFSFGIPGQKTISIIVALAGILILLLSMYAFRKAKTTIDPMSPDKASTLISSGIFGISRNPIYLALLCLLLAWIFRLGNLTAIVFGLTFLLSITHFQIRAEEKALENKFGEEYRKYKSTVRRWL